MSCLFSVLLAVTVSHAFLVFDDLSNVEGHWSDVLYNVPQSVLSDVSLRCGEEAHRGKLPIPSPSGKDADYDHDSSLLMLTLINRRGRVCRDSLLSSYSSLPF